MKFLHAADLHLGSALPGFAGRSPGALAEDADVTRLAFDNMVELARREDVAFVVIAGDLYDGSWKCVRAGLDVAHALGRLGKPCFILRGNHDATSIIPAGLRLPPNVTEFGSERCDTRRIDDLGIALHGHSFGARAVEQNLAAGYCAPADAMLNIGVLHTSAEGAEGHGPYAPCTAEGLARHGYDYWALGHVHQRRTLGERPWIVFPGNTQGRHIRETGPKGCTVVTVEDRRVVEVRHHDLDVLRWALIEVDVTGAEVLAAMDRIDDAVQAALDAADGRALAARLRLVGETAADARLRDDGEALLRSALDAGAAHGGQLWIERVEVRTTPLREPGEAPPRLDELRRRFFEALPEAAPDLLAELKRVRGEMPGMARDGLDLPHDAASLEALAAEAWALVEHRLGAETVT